MRITWRLIADAIGKPEDAKRYRKHATDMNARINAKLWNETLGLYCSRFWDKEDGTPGDFLTRITPANFYPLISGAADAARAKKVLAVMTDPEQFWGEWILPTVSRRDPLVSRANLLAWNHLGAGELPGVSRREALCISGIAGDLRAKECASFYG